MEGVDLAMVLNESLCEAFVREALRSDRCRQMLEPIPVAQRARIVCRPCQPELNARAYFDAAAKDVTLCYNHLPSKDDVEEALCHELVHAYDFIARRPPENIRCSGDLACSEIRAAFWGECRHLSDAEAKRVCVRNVASAATENMFPGIGARVVRARFDHCYHDRAPWDPVHARPE